MSVEALVGAATSQISYTASKGGVLALSLLIMVVFPFALIAGVMLVGPGQAAILNYTMPLWASLLAVPVLDPTAYLEASFKQNEDAPLLPGRVAIYRDGVFVGRGVMAAAGRDETVRLGFGADDKIKIERTVLKRNEGSAGLLVTTSKTDERTFKTTIRNGHDFPIKVAIEDQLPVSESEDIVVEILGADMLRDEFSLAKFVLHCLAAALVVGRP